MAEIWDEAHAAWARYVSEVDPQVGDSTLTLLREAFLEGWRSGREREQDEGRKGKRY